MDVERLIQRAQEGDLEAFAEVTRRFQHMAFGYAVALLRDLQQAEDVVQEVSGSAASPIPRPSPAGSGESCGTRRTAS
jgi:DNA-directed RNA polymerase specialized sigma24 family protein